MGWGANEELTGVLKQTPMVLDGMLAGRTAEQLAHKPAEDEWSVLEVVGHLNDVEEISIYFIELATGKNPPEMGGFDPAQKVREMGYQQGDIDEIAASFNERRVQRIALLESLSPEDWDRTIDLPGQGPLTVRQVTIHLAAHDVNHLAQIGALLAG